ncbi:hypothetical protein [Nesterenkonia flava]|uniref:Uncharacterized protein n=1 Tax=Nesterenkonia flava TaxID=469799 RepID=A0ABU1FRH4_9MICC|nr:hypothetical protein [Nesterenkonia flava]MDR5710842.1 hypothetical protein [Nesterenkonia flava]
MSAITTTASWIHHITGALDAKNLTYAVNRYNDVTLAVDDAEYVIRNTASVVPQRIHMLGYPAAQVTAQPADVEGITIRQEFENISVRARGRALLDHEGRVYFDLICIAGEPGEVPSQAQLEELLPQLIVLMTQMQQQLRTAGV